MKMSAAAKNLEAETLEFPLVKTRPFFVLQDGMMTHSRYAFFMIPRAEFHFALTGFFFGLN